MRKENEEKAAQDRLVLAAELAKKKSKEALIPKPEHLVVYGGDDQATIKYKEKINSLSDEKYRKEIDAIERGVSVDTPNSLKLQKKADCMLIFLWGIALSSWLGLVVWLFFTSEYFFGVAIGVVFPVTVVWYLVTWRKAKIDGRDVIFKR